jgi:sugar (pentulose or hexulose) kinase
MGEAGVLLDAEGRPLAPGAGLARPAAATSRPSGGPWGAEAFHRAVGMFLDSQPSLPKILWLRRMLPDARRAVRFCSVPEWVVVSLGGHRSVSSPWPAAPACSTSRPSRRGRPPCELLGRNLLSDLVQAGAPAGVADVSAPAAVRGATLTVAGHDHQAAALAVGAARDGALLDSLGTAEALLRCVRGPLDSTAVARLVAQRVTVGWESMPGHSTVMYGLRSGMVLEQLADLLGAWNRSARMELGQLALEIGGRRRPGAARVRGADLPRPAGAQDVSGRGVGEGGRRPGRRERRTAPT